MWSVAGSKPWFKYAEELTANREPSSLGICKRFLHKPHTNHIPELYAVTNRGNSKVGNTNDGNRIESDTDSDGKHLVSVELAHSKQGGSQRVGMSVTTQTETITDAQAPRLILGTVSTEVATVVLLQ